MLKGVLFNDEKYFDFSDNNNILNDLTNNTIILCEDNIIQDFLSEQLIDICRGVHKESGYDYCIENNLNTDDVSFKIGLSYMPTTELFIDETQKIIITMEMPYVLTAKEINDIWFATRSKNNKVSLCPMRVFKGSHKKWDEGIDAVYKYIIAGRYGSFSYANITEYAIGV